MTTPPPPDRDAQLDELVEGMHNNVCCGGLDDDGRPGPCGSALCPTREDLRAAVVAGRAQGLLERYR